MPLREEFEQQGNWLFRRRSWLPVVVLYPLAGVLMVAYPEATYDHITSPTWGIVCLLVGLLGLAVRALTIGCTPGGTSGRNTDEGQVAETLNETGIYSVVRHPLYLGNFLMWLGLFMILGVWWFVALCTLAYWLYYERIMYAEEEFLRRTYSARYEAWASRTPAFVPRLTGWQPALLEFSWRNVMKREYNGLFAMVVSFVLINAISHLLVDKRFYIDPLWQLVLAVGAVIFLVLRTLKKNTQLLEVPGR
ncbi:isoprenylcysteine carboxylmethyltransferase family protein [Hymenobacter sp. BT175]|uniref:methyltransferase family protein n=1 Tax=Hymenobacter translucens TaxID=2886507 RepID=UPI001D0E40E4|nr:isoprenylcysteine carboxylmethyltransferase family protein [Hymenobacter translucens]MCC2546967.1 isoprenylcysteine carboxylmethyltransferase family protein [Hymenobacter translucens]